MEDNFHTEPNEENRNVPFWRSNGNWVGISLFDIEQSDCNRWDGFENASSDEVVPAVVVVFGSSVCEDVTVDSVFAVDNEASSGVVVVISTDKVVPSVVFSISSGKVVESVDSLSVRINALYKKGSANLALICLGFVENAVRSLFNIILSPVIIDSQWLLDNTHI
uniref:Uncharacterized protein n=1 Tax=Glossina palpalis gambiensis TaxID=67801 RepID=A0A1B0B1R3_9MUSC